MSRFSIEIVNKQTAWDGLGTQNHPFSALLKNIFKKPPMYISDIRPFHVDHLYGYTEQIVDLSTFHLMFIITILTIKPT